MFSLLKLQSGRLQKLPEFRDEELEERRQRFFHALPAGALAIFVTNQEQLRNGSSSDNTFAHRPSSSVLYLSGFSEPNCVLVFDKTGNSNQFIMFVEPFDLKAEIWHGKRLGPQGAQLRCGADQAYKISRLKSKLTRMAAGARQIYFTSGNNAAVDKLVATALQSAGHQGRYRNADELLGELRLFKSNDESQVMHAAGLIGSRAHEAAMAFCRPGLSEYDLKAILEFTFAANQCEPSYGTIVAAGSNGLCLHYPAGHSGLKEGEMVLVDAGCELNGYASDISRTFPVNGKFSPAQKALYEVVLAAQEAAINAVRPGVTWHILETVCNAVLFDGLKALGFPMTMAEEDSPGKLRLQDLMPHGLGHWLGLDVHDAGRYKVRGFGSQSRKQVERPLEEGMVLTIEPGLYLNFGDQRIPKQYQGICLRIEDDVLVTDDGNLVLTDAAKTVEEIEAVMAHGRKLRQEGLDPLAFLGSR